jgi:hypothetical protein
VYVESVWWGWGGVGVYVGCVCGVCVHCVCVWGVYVEWVQ